MAATLEFCSNQIRNIDAEIGKAVIIGEIDKPVESILLGEWPVEELPKNAIAQFEFIARVIGDPPPGYVGGVMVRDHSKEADGSDYRLTIVHKLPAN